MKEIYAWVPYFDELANKIFDSGKEDLIDVAKRVDWKKEGAVSPLLDFGDEMIDPFSFIYTVAGNTKSAESRKRIFGSISEIFEMESELPIDRDEAFIFPTPIPTATLFHSGRKKGNPDLLWRLFRSAVSGFEDIDSWDFFGALAIDKVALAKLTQALFLVNSKAFIPIDQRTTSLELFPFDKAPKKITLDEYANLLNLLKAAFPNCSLFEINLHAYLRSTKKIAHPKKWFQISSNAYDDGVDHSPDFIENNYVYTGGPGKQREYPLDQPERGDVVLVRYGRYQGHGIGVVYRNDYQDEGWAEDRKLHVVWLNKVASNLSNTTTMKGFSEAKNQTYKAFRHTEAYAPTFEFLDRFSPADMNGSKERGDVKHPLNRILYGPPGTGKTWHAVNHALAIIDGTEVHTRIERERFDELKFNPDDGTGQIAMVTFHQNFAYEDFVEGIRPTLDGKSIEYELRDGIFKRLATVAAKNQPEHRFVLIIDEINRGNIAKIFGELITLIEDTRRSGQEDQTSVTLPYSGKRFAVPKNLFLIGTMNTADRSIQLLDTALRRRFTFMEMMPQPQHKGIAKNIDGVDCTRMLEIMNERISVLLDREHQIGHTYFLGVVSMDRLADTFQNRIFPLLQEYFFDDWAKIRAVLGNNAFVLIRNVENSPALTEFVGEERKLYERLPETEAAWHDPAEYCQIYLTKDTDKHEDI